MSRPRKVKPPKQGNGSDPDQKKNQYEIYADFTDQIAKLISKEAVRLKDLAKKMAPGKSDYTVGDFLTDQMKNAAKLMDRYNEASKED